MEPEDARLIAAFRAGDPAAVEQIKTWLTQAAYAYRSRIGAGWEDLRQDLLLEVTRLLAKDAFRGEARLRTYLWRVAICVCLKRVRTPPIRLRFDTGGLDNVRTPEHSPLERILARESQVLLQRLVAEMPAECRELWRMIGAGRSYREMSDALGVAEGTLRVRVLRCRRRAMQAWEESFGAGQEIRA